jgi:hypothetical protein
MRVLVAICSTIGATIAFAQYGPEHLPQPPEATRGQPVRPGAMDVTGRVVDVDPSSGRLVVNAEGKTWKLHFPPPALRDIHRGEAVTRSGIDSTSTEGAGSHATDPETGAPGARPPGAR